MRYKNMMQLCINKWKLIVKIELGLEHKNVTMTLVYVTWLDQQKHYRANTYIFHKQIYIWFEFKWNPRRLFVWIWMHFTKMNATPYVHLCHGCLCILISQSEKVNTESMSSFTNYPTNKDIQYHTLEMSLVLNLSLDFSSLFNA